MMEQYEYTVRCVRSDVYEVYKFEEGASRPVVTYTVFTFNSKYKCICPAGRYHKRCAHMDMVKKFRQMERTELPLAMITFRK